MDGYLELPPIKGITTTNVRLVGETLIADAQADDAEAVQEITALYSMFTAATHGATPQDVMNATREAMVCNTCTECGGGKFLRKYYISTRRSRVVDVLHCVGFKQDGSKCGKIIPVGQGEPDGLMPGRNSIIKARLATGNVRSAYLEQARPIEAELAAYP